MTTLRRELKMKVDKVLAKYHLIYEAEEVDEIVDAVLEVRGIALSIENAIATDQPVMEEMTGQAKQKYDAPRMFEKAFGFGSLPWGSGGDWQKLLEFVTDIYGRDAQAFGKYVVWRGGEGKYAAMSNKQIRMNPRIFMDTGWAEFENSQGKKTDEQRPEYKVKPQFDSHGRLINA